MEVGNERPVLDECEAAVDAVGVMEQQPAQPSAADLDRVAEEEKAREATALESSAPEPAADEMPVKETTLECGVEEQVDVDSFAKCKGAAACKVTITLLGQPLIQDLHLCAKHAQAVAAPGGVAMAVKQLSRIVSAGNGLVVPGR